MVSTNSPLECLAAFAIVFMVGVLSVMGLSGYVQRVRGQMPRPTHSN